MFQIKSNCLLILFLFLIHIIIEIMTNSNTMSIISNQISLILISNNTFLTIFGFIYKLLLRVILTKLIFSYGCKNIQSKLSITYFHCFNDS